MLNEDKDSVVIDVLLDDHREVLLRLLGQADVFIFGFRPAMLDQLGLSRNKLRARFPDLILCYISGYERRESDDAFPRDQGSSFLVLKEERNKKTKKKLQANTNQWSDIFSNTRYSPTRVGA